MPVVVVVMMFVAGVGLALWAVRGMVTSRRGERIDYLEALIGGAVLLVIAAGAVTQLR